MRALRGTGSHEDHFIPDAPARGASGIRNR
jgi:hypothetical protein